MNVVDVFSSCSKRFINKNESLLVNILHMK